MRCGIGLLGRPASESGILCRGDGAHERVRPRRRRVVMLAIPTPMLVTPGPFVNSATSIPTELFCRSPPADTPPTRGHGSILNSEHTAAFSACSAS